jgi:aminocarboxymuconate-semialdehyde decarboxylase
MNCLTMTMTPRCTCIDIHTHVVPEHFPAYIGRHVNAAWPSTVPAHACHRHVMLSGKVYRTVSDDAWDTARRVAAMDEQRVQRQVLSPMPELLSYWLDGEDGAAMARFLNEQIASMVTREPSRFIGLGSVPLQDVDRAIVELEFLVRELGLAGVEIGSNVNGVVLGDARLEPFFAAAESMGAAIFVHALRPAGMDRLIGPPNLEQLLAFPGETGLSAASMLTSGTLHRHPGLRIAWSHGGGTFASLLPRLTHGWNTLAALRESMPLAPWEGARRMYYDSLVYDAANLAHLIERFGATQICVGSDFPFVIRETDPVGRVDALKLDDATSKDLLVHNALRWLGLGG